MNCERNDMDDYQIRIRNWQAYNFPNATLEQQILGIMEELGELSHAILKHAQNIRGVDEATRLHAVKDAMGDMLVFMFNAANKLGVKLSDCLETAWQEIKDRDWQKYPKNGRTE